MYMGVDYYPEHTPRALWAEDIRLMQELRVNVVRMAEFGWSLMEPEEGQFDWSLFDDAIAMLHAAGIAVILGTPTATPPAWLIEKHPEILPVDPNGVRISFGGRRHYCFSAPIYRAHSARITRAMIERYGAHEAIIGWQTDNEYGHEGSDKCYCDQCRTAFHSWLQARYGTLDAVNEAWGTVFWSQTYTRWEQIPVPRKVLTAHNPGLLLDYHRFCSDQIVSFNRIQTEIIRAGAPGRFVTHNFVYLEQALDQRKVARDLDVIAFDNYPVWGGLPEPIPPAAIALNHDLCRGTKHQRYWVMEELAGAQGWDMIGYLPRPGHIKLWTYQAIAHGAEAIVYFRWRAAHFGTEEFCHGILDHDGKPKRKFHEVQQVAEELALIGDAWNAADLSTPVAIYYDPENAWAWQIQRQSSAFDYKKELVTTYNGFYRWHPLIDVVGPEEALNRYQVVIVPIYFLTHPTFTATLHEYVEQGGTVVLTYRSGVKEPSNAVVTTTLPGALADLAGVEIDEYESLQVGQHNRVVFTEQMAIPAASASVWCDILRPTTAEALAHYDDAFYKGAAAVTRNRYGKGTVYYVGTSLPVETWEAFGRHVLEAAGVPSTNLPRNVEGVRRLGDEEEFYVLLHHGEGQAEVRLEGSWQRADRTPVTSGLVELGPYETVVLRRPRTI